MAASNHMRYKLPLFLSLIFFLGFHKARASHAAGGELIYEYVNDTTYRLIFKFYRDCTGINEGQTVDACYENNCNSQKGSLLLNKLVTLPGGAANGSEISVGCPAYPTTCSGLSSALPGYREWWYEGIVKIPVKCNFWKFSVSIGNRNLSSNLAGTGGTFLYVEAYLNNASAPKNSSPYFSVKPVPYVCYGQPYTFNNGAIDPDGDSLSFEMLQPLTTSNMCPPNPYGMSYNTTANPPYNIKTNPFQTNNTFTLNPATGQMSFTPGLLGAHTITMLVKEFRNKILIGSIIRDIQVLVLTCGKQPTIKDTFSVFHNDSLLNGQIEACVDVPMSFCFNFTSDDASTILVAKDNHAVAAPGSTMTYTGLKTYSLNGCLSWTPKATDVGLKIFTVSVKDSTCKPPGISVSQTFDLPINVKKVENHIKDTIICPDDSVMLFPINGTSFTWSVLPGGSDAGTLSCIHCSNPFARPYMNTTYLVTTNQYAYCNRNIDTAVVRLKDRPENPGASNNSPICERDTLKLFAKNQSNSRYEWKGPNKFFDTRQNPFIDSARVIDTGYYFLKVFSTVTGCGSVSDSTHVFIKQPPNPAFELKDNVCSGEPTEMKPYWNYFKVEDYYWQFDGVDKIDTTKYNTYFLTWLKNGIKHVSLTEKGKNGCTSLPYEHNINVHALPAAKIADPGKNSVCAGDSLLLEAYDIDSIVYHWQPEKYFEEATGRTAFAHVPQTGYISVSAADVWGCIGKDSVMIKAEPCCDVYLPDAFTPNGDGKNDKYRLITNGHHTLSVFRIVNRWGQEVFGTNDEKKGWDGTLNGKDQDIGVYYYYLKYKCMNGNQIEQRGSFMLIK